MMTRLSRTLIAAALALLFTIPALASAQTEAPAGEQPPAQTQVPQPSEGGVNWSGVGFGGLALLANLGYIPVKLLYALTGGIVGAGTWALTAGNTQVANTVWRSSLGGDYVLTPGMIQGKEPINFSGPTETAPENQNLTAPPPAPQQSMGGPAEPAPSVGASEPIDHGTGPAERSIE